MLTRVLLFHCADAYADYVMCSAERACRRVVDARYSTVFFDVRVAMYISFQAYFNDFFFSRRVAGLLVKLLWAKLDTSR